MFAKMMAEWLLDDEVKGDLISQLNKEIDIHGLFWSLPVILYSTPGEGIIKKQIKITNLSEEDTEKSFRNYESFGKLLILCFCVILLFSLLLSL